MNCPVCGGPCSFEEREPDVGIMNSYYVCDDCGTVLNEDGEEV